jgi:hypothetical protein
MPNDQKVQICTKAAEVAVNKAKQMSVILSQGQTETIRVVELRGELRQIPDTALAKALFDAAEIKLGRAEDASTFLEQWLEANTTEKEAADFLKQTEEEYKTAADGYNEALSKVDVCPVTMKPISGECMKGVRIPVVRSEDADKVLQEKT